MGLTSSEVHDRSKSALEGGVSLWQQSSGVVRKSALTVLDQALVSSSNFVMGILLARWLAPAQYGAYAMAFAIFLLAALFHQALLLEPMSVLGPSLYAGRLKEYFAALLWIHLAVTLAIMLVLGGAAWVVYTPNRPDGLPGALAGVALASPFILLYYLVRRAFYWELAPARALTGAAVYCGLLGAGVFTLLRHQRLLTPFTAFVLMGAAALLTSVFQFLRIGPLGTECSVSETWRQHWNYGRWAVAGSIATWVPANIYFMVLGRFSGMASVAALKALTNLTLPIAQTITALSLFFLPYVARACQRHGSGCVERLTSKITFTFAAAAVVYWLAIVSLRQPVVHLLYGGKYGEISRWIPWIGLYSCLWCATHGQAIGLRAILAPASVFYAYGVASAIALVIGIPALYMRGISGAIASMVLSSGASLVAIVYLHRRKIRFLSSLTTDAETS
jgi:O-antigen/teichoic acid export membrane protein